MSDPTTLTAAAARDLVRVSPLLEVLRDVHERASHGQSFLAISRTTDEDVLATLRQRGFGIEAVPRGLMVRW